MSKNKKEYLPPYYDVIGDGIAVLNPRHPEFKKKLKEHLKEMEERDILKKRKK